MSLISSTAAAGNYAGPDVERLKGQKPGSLEQEKARLRKATQEFESLFMYQMLKAMRQTVGESSLAEGSPMSNSLGKDTFMDMFDVQLSQDMASGGTGSIADIMYKSMEKLVEARFNGGREELPLGPLRPEKPGPIKVTRPELPVEQPGARLHDLQGVKPGPIPLRSSSAPPVDSIRERFGDLIDEAAERHELDSALISAVIRTESNGNPEAVSPAGAKGLMQLMDGTAADLGVKQVFDSRENVMSGTRYLRRMLDRFGDVRQAVAAYNAGPGAVERHGGIPPYRETTAYVEKVMDAYEFYRGQGPDMAPKAP